MNNKSSHIFLSLLFCFFGIGIWAQTFSFRKLTVEDGLPSSYLYDIVQDKDGFIWLATEEGICKFDGISFEQNPIPELSSEEVINLFFDSKGRLWMSLINGQVVYYEDGVLHNVSLEDFSLNNQIVVLKEDSDQKVWIVTRSKNAFRLDSIYRGKIVKYKNFPFPQNAARIMECTEESNFFFGKEDYSEINNDSIIKKAYPKEFSVHYPVFSTIKGKNIFFTDSENIYSLNCEDKKISLHFTKYLKYIDKGINSINIDKDGNFWLGSKDGLHFLRHNKDDDYTIHHLLKGHFVGIVFQDKDDNFWVTTQKDGLFFIPSTQINVLDKNSGLSNNRIATMALHNDGNIIAGYDDNSYNFISIIPGTKPEILHQDRLTEMNYEIYDLLSHPDGNIYFFSSAGLFIKAENSPAVKKQYFSFKVGKYAKDGSIWAGTSFSTIRLDGYDKILNERTYALAPISENEAWIGSVKGLYHYTTESGARKTNVINSDTDIRSLEISSSGDLWVGCKSDGIYILKDNKIKKHFTINDGLPSNSCRHIYLGDHYAWIATNNGIAKISLTDHTITIINQNDGLPSREINDILRKDELIIAATNGGIAYFPHDIKTRSPKPSINVNAIRINEKDTLVLPSYQLEYENNNIKVDFVGIAFQSVKDLVYNIKMEGLDEDWLSSEVGKAEYPSLSPGSYTLLIKAKTLDSDWSDITSIRIEIMKPYWNRWWFFILMTVLMLLTMGLIIYSIDQRIKQKNAIEDNLRKSRLTALRSQMNPHFMFNSLNSIQEFILMKDKKSANKYLSRFSKLMRAILDMSDVNEITLEKELKALELYLDLEAMRFEGEFEYHIHLDKNIEKESAMIPSMLIQPYVENAIKHGLMHKFHNRKLNLSFAKEGEYLVCTVDDNGIGRKKAMEISQEYKRSHQPKAMSVTEERLTLLNSAYQDDLNLKIIDKTDENGLASGTKIIIYIRQKE